MLLSHGAFIDPLALWNDEEMVAEIWAVEGYFNVLNFVKSGSIGLADVLHVNFLTIDA